MSLKNWIKYQFCVEPRCHILTSQPLFWRKFGTGGCWPTCSPGPQNKGEDTFLFTKHLVWILRRHPGGSRWHVQILTYTTLCIERIPTSQKGFSVCLVPSRQSIMRSNIVTDWCIRSDHPSCWSNASGASIAVGKNIIWPIRGWSWPLYWSQSALWHNTELIKKNHLGLIYHPPLGVLFICKYTQMSVQILG